MSATVGEMSTTMGGGGSPQQWGEMSAAVGGDVRNSGGNVRNSGGNVRNSGRNVCNSWEIEIVLGNLRLETVIHNFDKTDLGYME